MAEALEEEEGEEEEEDAFSKTDTEDEATEVDGLSPCFSPIRMK